MAKTLVLAEKPSVGKELARVLGCRRGGEGYMEGDRYVVTWALGHLVTLADPDVYDKKLEKWEAEYYRDHRSLIDLKPRYTKEELAERDRINAMLG